MASNPVANPGSRKKDIGSIGCSLRRSHRTKPTSSSTAPTVQSKVSLEVHPWFGASMMVYSRAPSAATDSRPPTGSRGVWWSSFDSGTTTAHKSTHRSAKGTLIRNTACHVKVWTAQPPTKRPMGAPMPAMAAQMPMALGRSSRGKTVTTIESVAGMTIAAPRPMTARAAMTSALVSALNAVHAAAPPTTTNPSWRADRRPKRSPRAPIISRVPPKTRA